MFRFLLTQRQSQYPHWFLPFSWNRSDKLKELKFVVKLLLITISVDSTVEGKFKSTTLGYISVSRLCYHSQQFLLYSSDPAKLRAQILFCHYHIDQRVPTQDGKQIEYFLPKVNRSWVDKNMLWFIEYNYWIKKTPIKSWNSMIKKYPDYLRRKSPIQYCFDDKNDSLKYLIFTAFLSQLFRR